MNSNADLFPQEAWNFIPDPTRKEPFFWVKEFRFYSELREDKLIRSISLRPGLNILWAKPADVSNITLKQGGGISGHSAGKSLFCRLLRFLLGESTFATKPVKDAILNRFINSVVVAEVVISGTHWLVMRHLLNGQGEVLRGGTIAQLFEENLFKEPYKAFREHLNFAIMQRMALRTFPGSSKNIEWGHILPFLTRDQECRMQNLAQWRSPMSESDAPSPSVAENCHIIRGVLNLMDEKEEEAIRAHAKMLSRKSELDKRLPSLEYHYQKQKDILLRDFPATLIDQFQLAADDMLSLAFERLAEEIQTQLTAMQKPLISQYNILLNFAVAAEGKAALQAEKVKDEKRNLHFDITRLRLLLRQPEKKKLSWLEANKNAAPNRCNVFLSEARKSGCPFAFGKPIDTDSHVHIEQMLDDAIKDQQEGIAAQRAYVKQLSQEAKKLRDEAVAARKCYDEAIKKYSNDSVRFLEERNKLHTYQRLVQDTMRAYEDLTRAQNEFRELESDIKSSLEDQKVLRSQSIIKERERHFNDVFQEILRNVLEPEIFAKIELLADRININAEYNGSVRGTTLDIVKLIAFDYAALITGLENANGHPGFLIHDSPREADMSEDIYQRMLLFMKDKIEDMCSGIIPFQYIITTTAKPPAKLSHSPWLLSPCLDASIASSRLLGFDF